MNYFMEDANDLDDQELNFTISGPSKSSRKSKTGKISRNTNHLELGGSLLNLTVNHKDVTAKFEKHKNKTKSKTSRNTNIKQLLSNRLKMYNSAEDNARKIGETKKARELSREIQILNALIVHHDSGNIVDLDNIPPEIKKFDHGSKATNAQQGVTFKESAEIALIRDFESATSSEAEPEMGMEKILGILRLRRDQYKISVVQNKGVGNVPRALEHLNTVKMFDSVIRHLEMGEKVDLNKLPGPPECSICHINFEEMNKDVEKPIVTNISESSIDEQIMSHSTILQALQKRLQAYEILKKNAKKENNMGESLRIVRIIKVYKEAIRLHRAQKPFPIEDLPSPPGFPSIHNIKSSSTTHKPLRFKITN